MESQTKLAPGNGTTQHAPAKLSDEEINGMTLRQLQAVCPAHRRYHFTVGGMPVDDREGKLIVPYLSAVDDQSDKTAGEVKAQAAEKQRAEHVAFALDNLFDARGERYRRCTLESFEVSTDDQRKVVSALKAYRAEIRERVQVGQNILLTGPSGTGKDHLLTDMMVAAISEFASGFASESPGTDATVLWTSGAQMWAAFRDMIGRAGSSFNGRIRESNCYCESDLLKHYTSATVLCLSDPKPVTGQLSAYQAETLYRIVDERYNTQRPVWASINAASREEAETAIGVPIIDRLRDGALSLACDWPSHRRAAK